MAKPTLLLDAHLKALRLPTFLREYDKVARQCAQEGLDCSRYLFRLCELEFARSRTTRRRAAHQGRQVPGLEESRDLRVPRDPVGEQTPGAGAGPLGVSRPARETCWRWATPARARTHLALALGLAACQKGYRVRFTTAAALVNELLEARDDKRLLRFQKQLAKQDLLIVDERGYVPLSKTGAELLFEIFSQRYEQASTLVTSNLPFNEWTEIFGSERLTDALLDRLTHHVHILELNGESDRLEHSKKARQPAATPAS